jgi:hypothetical protein
MRTGCIVHNQAAIKSKWDAQNNGSVTDCLNKEFGMFSKSVKKVFVAQVRGVTVYYVTA